MKKAVMYVLGSAALAAVAFVVLPPLIDSLSGYLYTNNNNNKAKAPVDDDDWGPEIVRKEDL